MRTFKNGATRDDDDHKIDPEGFLNPQTFKEYCEYMHKHRVQADGKLRPSDNWQSGFGKDVCMKSMMRHVLDAWLEHRGYESRDGMKDALGGVIFNAFAYWLELVNDEPTTYEVSDGE